MRRANFSSRVGRGMGVDELKVLQKTELLHEGRWWEPVGGGRCALLFVSAALPDS